jgi:anhydro-N-acetylmuramic acid kinase
MMIRHTIGLAPGSCCDGVEAALLEIGGVGLDIVAKAVSVIHDPYPRELRPLLLRVVSSSAANVKQLTLLHRLLGEVLAQAARKVTDQVQFHHSRVQCIGCPGQWIGQEPDSRYPAALELGMAAVVAERTGLTTISDFRSRDLAAGGQGTPLEALADHVLFRHPQENRAIVHLGSAASVVVLPAGGRVQEVLGFEAGPCNRLLDHLMRRLTGGRETRDAGGKHAVQGRCIDTALQRWLEHPFWQRRPPRSLSQDAFGDDFAAQAVLLAREQQWGLHDLLCTATHLVVHGVVQALTRFLPRLPDRILLSGGGARNGLIWQLLRQKLPGSTLQKTDELGVPADSRRALAHGILAALTMDGVPASVPAATGASGARLLGSLTPGSSSNWARCLTWMAQQTAPLAGMRM